MAIDSAKVLGLPIDVEIYDSEETKIVQMLQSLKLIILKLRRR
jgi:hypothetical protein